MSSRLVGRGDELATLVGALDAVGAGRASLVQVTGEPGIGKTRLVTEVCEIAEARGALVLAGRGAELEHDVPFGIIIDALDDFLGSFDDSRLGKLCGRQLEQLCRLFPALVGLGPRGTRGAEDERYATYRALRTLIERLASPGPLVLVLDDLHWADTASVEFVSFLLRRPIEARVLVVLAWRPGQAPGLVDTLSVRARDHMGTTISLSILGENEIAELLGGTLEPSDLAALYRTSGGNPFYAQALALGAARRGSPRWSRGQGSDESAIPAAVTAAVRQEVAALAPAPRLLAQGAAVAGEPFESGIASHCADLGTDEALCALDELVATGIFHATDSPRRFAFRHPIVRRAVYDSTDPSWRLAAHSRATDALAEAGAPITARAHHVARSGVFGDLGAAQLLMDAAAKVVGSAPSSAAAWLEAASAIVPHRPETTGTRLELQMAKAQVACLLGDLEAGREGMLAALELVPVGDGTRLPLVAACAGVEHGLGRFAEARHRLVEQLGELASADSAAEASLYLELAVSFLFTLDLTEAEAFAASALQATAGLDRVLEGTARGLLAFVQASAETPEKNRAARAECTEAMAILDNMDDVQVATRLDALYYLGWAERLLEHYEAAATHLGRAMGVAEAGGGSQWLVPTMVEYAKVLASCGRIIDARELAETAVEMARVSGVGLLLLLALTAEIAVLTAAGDTEAALSAGAEALGLCVDGAGYHATNIRRRLGLARLGDGDAEGFRAELTAIDKAETGDGGPKSATDGMACRLLEARCRAELNCGQTETAGNLASRNYELAIELDLPASIGFAIRAQARVSALAGPEEALALAWEAAGLFERSGALADAAQTTVLVAELLSRSGRRSEALSECRVAGEKLAAYGAKGAAREARLALRRLRRAGAGSAQHGRVVGGAAALSRRENEIAELVADGRSNREIALGLSISVNTVESHLGHILAKLGATGRGAVARAMARDDDQGGLTSSD